MAIQINTTGDFYTKLHKQNNYAPDTQQCIQHTVSKLLTTSTTIDKPGMRLGKIQSGKTRTFIGVTGLAFDNGFDVAIVLTKGTKALARQTVVRLQQEFASFVDYDEMQIFDIMTLPTNLTPYELGQKLIIVVKKEKRNMERLGKALFETYPELASKKTLIIDDEADYASVGFTAAANETVDMNVIAGQISDIRTRLADCSFLQVTATPYALYLQPDDIVIRGEVFKPIRPAFTELVPVPSAYVGGEFYFERREEEDSIASHLHVCI
ncbi:MAG: Z1 domain-containing protein, partial [Bacilli bacterium]